MSTTSILDRNQSNRDRYFFINAKQSIENEKKNIRPGHRHINVVQFCGQTLMTSSIFLQLVGRLAAMQWDRSVCSARAVVGTTSRDHAVCSNTYPIIHQSAEQVFIVCATAVDVDVC
jgi:hypothetical protein